MTSGTLDLTELVPHLNVPAVTLPLVHQSVRWLEIAAERHGSLFRLMARRVPDQRGTQFRKRIGANDARHREYLVALARQLTSSASLKCKGCR